MRGMSFRAAARSRRAVRVGLTVLIASALAYGNAALAQTSPTAPTYTLSKAGFGIAPGAGFFINNPNLPRSLDDFERLGVRWIRSVIPWQNFEPNDPATLGAGTSPWNWKGVDAFVATMHSPAYNGRFSLIVNIDNPPTWATNPARIAHVNCATQPPFSLAAYAQAAVALAQHLQGTAAVFELGNSENIGVKSAAHDYATAVWPTPNPCGYAQLLKLTTPAIHAAVPGTTVLVGGLGGTRDRDGVSMSADTYLAALYSNGARGSFDGVSYHPYSTPYLPCDPTAAACTFDANPSPKDPYGMTNGWDRMLNARNIMVSNGDSAKKIWITEFGGPTNGPAASSTVLTQAQQAALLAAGLDRASQDSWVAEFCWFTYQDQPGANPGTSPAGDFMGLVNADFTPKLIFTSYQTLSAGAL